MLSHASPAYYTVESSGADDAVADFIDRLPTAQTSPPTPTATGGVPRDLRPGNQGDHGAGAEGPVGRGADQGQRPVAERPQEPNAGADLRLGGPSRPEA